MNKREQARILKQKGLSYSQIGKLLRVSRQRAQQLVTIPKSELDKLRIATNGVCQKCGKKSKKLDGHHESYDNNEIIMVCVSCHMRGYPKTGGLMKNFSIRRQGDLNEQVERLCKAWKTDASKAIRRAVAEADAREQAVAK